MMKCYMFCLVVFLPGSGVTWGQERDALSTNEMLRDASNLKLVSTDGGTDVFLGFIHDD